MLPAKKTTFLFLAIIFLFLTVFAALLFWTTEQWQKSSDSAALGQTEAVAENFYLLEKNRASESIDSLIKSRYLQQAKDDRQLKKRLNFYLARGEIIGAEVTGSGGILLDNIGGPGVFSKKISIRVKRRVKTIQLEKTSPTIFLNELRSLTGQEFSLYRGEQILASTIPGKSLPKKESSLGTEGLRISSLQLRDLQLISGVYQEEVFISNKQIIIPVLLFLFLGIIIILHVSIQRGARRNLRGLLEDIRQIGKGQNIPENKRGSSGEAGILHQAIKQTGQEVSHLLSSLQRAKERLEKMIQKSGDVFAIGPSEDETLRLLLDLALSSTDAQSGIAINSQSGERYARLGDIELDPLLQILKESERKGMIEKETSENFLLAVPLLAFDKVIGGLALSKNEPFSKNEKEAVRYLASQTQVALENSALHTRLKKEAATDDLTGLANRRTMRQSLEREFARSLRFKRPLSLLLLDIDNFKEINDTYGHSEGDLVLREIAQTIQKTLRHIDLVARWGGEEFLVLLPETGTDEARRAAQRIQKMIRNTGPNLEKKITASIGIATYPQDGDSSGDIILLADQAMYKAKKSGKDCISSVDD